MEELSRGYDVIEGRLDPETLELAQRLAPEHLAPGPGP
jgi:hypothetical protein